MKIEFIDRKTGDIKIERPPSEGLLKFLYANPFGKKALLPIVKRKMFSVWYGKKMDKASSVKRIPKFIEQFGIDMNEAEREVSEYTSFNDFFFRKLKPNARPIEEGFVSPGDGRLLAFEDVSELSEFYIKGQEFTLAEFLADITLSQKYKNSSMFILRLAPNDYHRFHFPYDGIPTEITKIKGRYLSVSPYALKSNFTKVFCGNKREYCELKTKDKGDILIAPVGAAMVGTIIETYKPEDNINKGNEMGYFKFGGSTIVILIDKDKITIDKDILENTKNRIETEVRMGEKIAK